MADDLVKQAIAELQDLVRCRCQPVFIHGPDCNCDTADAVQTVADRIEELEMTLAAALEMALTECPFRHGTASYNGWWDDRKILVESLRG